MDDGRSDLLGDWGPRESEADWRTYRELAPAAVPSRAEQIATLLTLFPFQPDHSFKVVELGAGEGHLSYAVMGLWSQASVMALDGSPEMLEQTKARLRRFGHRAVTDYFDLGSPDWLPLVDGVDVVVSSLCLHHLDGDGKRSLFRTLRDRMSDRGALLIADLVESRRAEAHRLFAETWDHFAHQQSVSETGTADLFDLFVAAEWNVYRYPDPMDTPSPLFDQLRWLQEAGFNGVDCFWMRAAHAIYGGFCAPDPGAPAGVSYAEALAAATAALRT